MMMTMMANHQKLYALILTFTTAVLLTTGPTTSHSYMTVGLACFNNDTCTGDNEFCFVRRDFDIPCHKGLCACLPGYILDGAKCAKKVLVQNLGDPCDLQNFGQFYGVDNADCYGSLVACNPGYYRQGNSCISETTCLDGRLCPSDMYCDTRQKCSCYYDKRFDLATQTCIKREFGDACRKDTECQVQGRDLNGYTFRSGSCIDGACACSEGAQPTTVSYIDWQTNTFRTKTICVSSAAIVNATNGTTCTLDPVYWSDIADTVVCEPTHLCYQCPEDYQYPDYGKNFYGRCRKIRADIVAETSTPAVLIASSVTEEATTASTQLTSNIFQSTPNIEIIIRYFNRTISSPTVTLAPGTTLPASLIPAITDQIPPAFLPLMKPVKAKSSTTVTTTTTTPSIVITPATRAVWTAACALPEVTSGRFFCAGVNATWVPFNDSAIPGMLINLICENGKIVASGAEKSVCLLNGRWSDAFGTCQRTTTASTSTSTSTTTTTTTTTSTTTTSTTTLATLLYEIQNCQVPVAINGALSTSDLNIVDVFTVRPGSLMTLTCNGGYVISRGSNQSVCLTDGTWWNPLGICSRLRI